jgi:DNA-binding MarR family transcriptional regulator
MVTRNLERLDPKPQSGDPPEQVIGFLFKSLHHSLRQAVDEALRRHGVELSFAHFATLFGLHYEPGSTGAQLARRAMVSPQTMTPVLRRLEAEGLIERRPHPESRRADSWFLTEEGTKQFLRARAVGEEVFSRMLSALDAAELERLQDYLGRCISALGSSPAEAAAAGKSGRADAGKSARAERKPAANHGR